MMFPRYIKYMVLTSVIFFLTLIACLSINLYFSNKEHNIEQLESNIKFLTLEVDKTEQIFQDNKNNIERSNRINFLKSMLTNIFVIIYLKKF